MKKLILAVVLLIAISSSFSLVAVNSKDWRAIYLGVEYARLKGDNPVVIYNEKDVKSLTGNVILISYSESVPNAGDLLKLMGVKYKEIKANNIVQLEEKLFNNKKNFCLVDSNFGYYALALSPDYKNCVVIFYDRDHVASLINFLKGKDVKVYVHDGILIDKLAENKINYVLMNESYNAVDLNMIKKYKTADVMELMDSSYVDPTVLFLRPIILSDANFTEVAKVLNESNVKLIEVIGVQEIPKAYELKDLLSHKISFVVKYGKIVVSQTSAKTYPLNLIDSGKIIESLKLDAAYYNTKTGHLILEFENNGTVPVMFYTTLSNGVKDDYIHGVNPSNKLFVAYATNFSNVVSGTTLYGMHIPLSKFINGSNWKIDVSKVSFSPEIKFNGVYFNKTDYAFYFSVESNKKTQVEIEIYNLSNKSYSSGVVEVNGEKLIRIPVNATLDQVKSNKEIHVSIYAGNTVLDLYKKFDTKYSIRGGEVPIYFVAIVVAAVGLAIVVYYIIRRRK